MGPELISDAKSGYLRFIRSCRQEGVNFCLTPRAEPTAYARCFAVFGLHLLQRHEDLAELRSDLVAALRAAVYSARKEHSCTPEDKPYRQLLTFTLSALAILDGLDDDRLADLVKEQIPSDMEQALRAVGALEGRPQSGNQAMFLAIFLLHARDRLGLDVGALLDSWVELHLSAMNRFGFWGNDGNMRHLSFQNGYHQYEILEYLAVSIPCLEESLAAVRGLADAQGHFAPYPGGGGCYDYDAIFLLTPEGVRPSPETEKVLKRTFSSLLREQSPEGGWAESNLIRPRTAASLWHSLTHVFGAMPRWGLFRERLRYAVALQRPLHDRIHTHWSSYSREWGEPDLWDSWFRLMALARIEVALDPAKAGQWGFINYPGIGYHPSLRRCSDKN